MAGGGGRTVRRLSGPCRVAAVLWACVATVGAVVAQRPAAYMEDHHFYCPENSPVGILPTGGIPTRPNLRTIFASPSLDSTTVGRVEGANPPIPPNCVQILDAYGASYSSATRRTWQISEMQDVDRGDDDVITRANCGDLIATNLTLAAFLEVYAPECCGMNDPVTVCPQIESETPFTTFMNFSDALHELSLSRNCVRDIVVPTGFPTMLHAPLSYGCNLNASTFILYARGFYAPTRDPASPPYTILEKVDRIDRQNEWIAVMFVPIDAAFVIEPTLSFGLAARLGLGMFESTLMMNHLLARSPGTSGWDQLADGETLRMMSNRSFFVRYAGVDTNGDTIFDPPIIQIWGESNSEPVATVLHSTRVAHGIVHFIDRILTYGEESFTEVRAPTLSPSSDPTTMPSSIPSFAPSILPTAQPATLVTTSATRPTASDPLADLDLPVVESCSPTKECSNIRSLCIASRCSCANGSIGNGVLCTPVPAETPGCIAVPKDSVIEALRVDAVFYEATWSLSLPPSLSANGTAIRTIDSMASSADAIVGPFVTPTAGQVCTSGSVPFRIDLTQVRDGTVISHTNNRGKHFSILPGHCTNVQVNGSYQLDCQWSSDNDKYLLTRTVYRNSSNCTGGGGYLIPSDLTLPDNFAEDSEVESVSCMSAPIVSNQLLTINEHPDGRCMLNPTRTVTTLSGRCVSMDGVNGYIFTAVVNSTDGNQCEGQAIPVEIALFENNANCQQSPTLVFPPRVLDKCSADECCVGRRTVVCGDQTESRAPSWWLNSEISQTPSNFPDGVDPFDAGEDASTDSASRSLPLVVNILFGVLGFIAVILVVGVGIRNRDRRKRAANEMLEAAYNVDYQMVPTGASPEHLSAESDDSLATPPPDSDMLTAISNYDLPGKRPRVDDVQNSTMALTSTLPYTAAGNQYISVQHNSQAIDIAGLSQFLDSNIDVPNESTCSPVYSISETQFSAGQQYSGGLLLPPPPFPSVQDTLLAVDLNLDEELSLVLPEQASTSPILPDYLFNTQSGNHTSPNLMFSMEPASASVGNVGSISSSHVLSKKTKSKSHGDKADPKGGNRRTSKPKRFETLNQVEWQKGLKAAVRSAFVRLELTTDKKIANELLGRILAGEGTKAFKGQAAGLECPRPCFLVQRKNLASKSPFQVQIGNARMVAQKVIYACHQKIKPTDMGTWQVHQQCLHNDDTWWCFEPTHLKKCEKDHIPAGIARNPIPSRPEAYFLAKSRKSRKIPPPSDGSSGQESSPACSPAMQSPGTAVIPLVASGHDGIIADCIDV